MKVILSIFVLLTSVTALADQCQALSKQQAEAAVSELLSAKKIQTFCQPCGEAIPETLDVFSVLSGLSLSKGISNENAFHEVLVIARYKGWVGLDAAYTYVDGINLASKIGCEAQGVSLELKEKN
jgi:hypothetical protein